MKRLRSCCLKLFRAFFPLRESASVLIIGLGNRNVAADSLGPLTVSGLLISRHIRETVPEELRNELRPVCALAPGVMGQTGIETLEIVCGIQDRIHADAIILIDALAARSISRVNTTIQLTDTGIRPGAGIGNRRQMLSSKNLGAPVIALGIPTVVDARTMILDAGAGRFSGPAEWIFQSLRNTEEHGFRGSTALWYPLRCAEPISSSPLRRGSKTISILTLSDAQSRPSHPIGLA